MVGQPINPQDGRANAEAGRKAFADGWTDPVAVLRAHRAVNRGPGANRYFVMGYREMAAKAGKSVGNALQYLDWKRSPEEMWAGDLARYKTIMGEQDDQSSIC